MICLSGFLKLRQKSFAWGAKCKRKRNRFASSRRWSIQTICSPVSQSNSYSMRLGGSILLSLNVKQRIRINTQEDISLWIRCNSPLSHRSGITHLLDPTDLTEAITAISQGGVLHLRAGTVVRVFLPKVSTSSTFSPRLESCSHWSRLQIECLVDEVEVSA